MTIRRQIWRFRLTEYSIKLISYFYCCLWWVVYHVLVDESNQTTTTPGDWSSRGVQKKRIVIAENKWKCSGIRVCRFCLDENRIPYRLKMEKETPDQMEAWTMQLHGEKTSGWPISRPNRWCRRKQIKSSQNSFESCNNMLTILHKS